MQEADAEHQGRSLQPVDREVEKLGYHIESRVPGSGKLRFIEVKGRVSSRARELR
jgi:hypothetical protein